jgi:geranylgeranylglycerol-phosphate geranylgeranyltransferase
MVRQQPLGSTSTKQRARRALLALAVVHPAPSAINAALVATLAIVAGAGQWVAGLLAIAMLGFQFSIGALNDIVDIDADRLGKPWKPIPAGKTSIPFAVAIVVLGMAIGLAVSASFGIVVLALGALGHASGVAYDLRMRRLGLGWLCLAAAFPLMLAWTWVAAAGTLPPGWPSLLLLAALAGPAIHLANSLVDVGSDERVGSPSLATQLGPSSARKTLAALMVVILVLAWATLASVAIFSGLAVIVALLATMAAALGVALSWQEAAKAREAGWLLQAVGLATMAVAWLASMAGA